MRSGGGYNSSWEWLIRCGRDSDVELEMRKGGRSKGEKEVERWRKDIKVNSNVNNRDHHETSPDDYLH